MVDYEGRPIVTAIRTSHTNDLLTSHSIPDAMSKHVVPALPASLTGAAIAFASPLFIQAVEMLGVKCWFVDLCPDIYLFF